MHQVAWIMIVAGVALMAYAWRHRSELRPSPVIPVTLFGGARLSLLEIEAGRIVPARARPVRELFCEVEEALASARRDLKDGRMPNPWAEISDHFVSPRYLAPAFMQVRR